MTQHTAPNRRPRRPRPRPTHRRRAAGLSIVELLIALAISAMLMLAVMLALNASFYAYASASETASAQSSSRLVMMRLMQLIRTSTLHDAYDPDDSSVTLLAPALPPVESVGIQMYDHAGNLLRIWWQVNDDYSDEDLGDLMYQFNSGDELPMLEGVRVQRTDSDEPYVFSLASRSSEGGLLAMRVTMDLTVEPAVDSTLALEAFQGASAPIRLIASTMPRRNLD